MNTEFEQFFSRMEEVAREHGVAIYWADDDPSIAYTVGLSAVGLPEFYSFGLPASLAQDLLNDLAFAVLGGDVSLSSGDRVHHLVRDDYALLLAVSQPDDSLLMVAQLVRDRISPDRSGEPMRALQVIFADRNGLWPWDDGAVHAPLLGALPSAEARRDVTLPARS